MVHKYVEIGIGNETFINTEIEYDDGTEKRQKGFVKLKVDEVYIRCWIGYKVYILSSKEWFKKDHKKKQKFKLLLGIAGK